MKIDLYPRTKPCDSQTPEEIEAYYRNVEVGSPACVRETHGGILNYYLTEVEGLNPKRGRVYLKVHGGFYAKSGKNCFEPTGQCRLVIPTDAVREHAATYPPRSSGYSQISGAYTGLFKK